MSSPPPHPAPRLRRTPEQGVGPLAREHAATPRGAEGRRGPQPTTYVFAAVPQRPPPSAPGSPRRLCPEFCLWSPCSLDCSWPASLLRTMGSRTEPFQPCLLFAGLFWRPSPGYAFSSPENKRPEQEPGPQGPGNCPPHSPRGGDLHAPPTVLPPPLHQRPFSRTPSWEALASWALCPPWPSCEGQLSFGGLNRGAEGNRPVGACCLVAGGARPGGKA